MRELPSLEGRLLAGRYRALHLIGSGGMGAVYAGLQEDLNRRVALKVLLGSTKLAPSELGRFRQEALAAAELGHPNIVQVTDFQAWPGEPPILVMEMLEGESLRSLLTREHRLAPGRAAFIATQILAALGAAHAAGIIHRDIKPPNVFLTRTPAMSDLVKVLDFGIAKVPRLADGFVTRPGAVLGTPAYMAPEQAAGHEVDARIDLYAVGVCLFEMLAGRRPFVASTPGELLGLITSEAAPPLRSIAPGVDQRLAAVVDRALRRDPRERPGSALEMLDQLAPWSRTDSTLGATPDFPTTQGSGETALLPPMTSGTRGPSGTGVMAPLPAPSSPTYPADRPPPLHDSQTHAPRASAPTIGSVPHATTPSSTGPLSAPRTGLYIALAIGVVVLSMLLVGAVTLTRHLPVVQGAASPNPTIPSPTPPNVVRGPWIVLAHRAAVGDFVGDATTDYAIRVLSLESKDEKLAVFDGRTNTMIWSTPLAGAPWAFGRGTVVVGKTLVVLVSNSLVRIHDATTGRELRSASTNAMVRQICRPTTPDGARQVWVEMHKASVMLNVETGGVTTSDGPPEGCWPTSVFARMEGTRGYAPTARLKVPEGEVDHARLDGDIAVGELNDAIASNPLVGVSLSRNKILWRLPHEHIVGALGPVVDIIDQRAYVTHVPSLADSSVDCVDIKTGTVLWSTPLGQRDNETSSAAFAGGRAYFTTKRGLYIVNAANGEVLSVVGKL